MKKNMTQVQIDGLERYLEEECYKWAGIANEMKQLGLPDFLGSTDINFLGGDGQLRDLADQMLCNEALDRKKRMQQGHKVAVSEAYTYEWWCDSSVSYLHSAATSHLIFQEEFKNMLATLPRPVDELPSDTRFLVLTFEMIFTMYPRPRFCGQHNRIYRIYGPLNNNQTKE